MELRLLAVKAVLLVGDFVGTNTLIVGDWVLDFGGLQRWRL